MSLVVSITLTPVMAYYMLPSLKKLDEHEGWLVSKLKGGNRVLLGWSFRHPKTLMGWRFSRRLAAGTAAIQLPRSFLPPFNEGSFTINLLFNPGISLAESHRVGLIAEQLMMQIPEVRQVGRARVAPSWMSMRRGSTRPRLRSTSSLRAARRRRSLPTSARGSQCCLSRQMLASHLAPPRPYALGRPRADRT